MSRRLRVLALIVLAGSAVAALAVFGLASNRSVVAGHRAPALPSEHLAGPAITLPGLIASAHGRPSLVVFWASWCGPCLREAPAIERFSRSPAGSGRVAGVDWSDARPGAVAFIRRYGWSFPNVRDSEGTVGNDYHLTGLPTTFVLDGRGRIRSTLRGPQNEASLGHALAGVEAR
jgi:cytochrome c biogenesis protein CcmG/thiol:disulfide interchange protein DsbE